MSILDDNIIEQTDITTYGLPDINNIHKFKVYEFFNFITLNKFHYLNDLISAVNECSKYSNNPLSINIYCYEWHNPYFKDTFFDGGIYIFYIKGPNLMYMVFKNKDSNHFNDILIDLNKSHFHANIFDNEDYEKNSHLFKISYIMRSYLLIISSELNYFVQRFRYPWKSNDDYHTTDIQVSVEVNEFLKNIINKSKY